MDERLLRTIIKSKTITVEEMQSFFRLNKEEMIELLILFLEHDIDYFDSSMPEENKYLFYTLDLIEKLYDKMEQNKSRLPYYQKFKMLKQELYDLSHMCKKKATQRAVLSIEERIYLEIYYYKNIKRIKELLSDEIINSIDDSPLVENIITSYVNSLQTNEYQYYKEILEWLIQNSGGNHHLLFRIVHFLETSLNIIIHDFQRQNINRLREVEALLSNIHTKLTTIHRTFDVSNEKYPTIERPFIFTIDECTTYIREDAISVCKEGDNLYITMYIIDPCDNIFDSETRLNEAIDNWFYRDSDHLLDHKYAQKHFSLNQGQARKVVAFEYCFDKSKKITKLNIFEDKIRVNRNYTYDEITELLNQKQKDNMIIPYLKELYEVVLVLHDHNIYKKKYHLLKQLHYYLNHDTKYKQAESKNGYLIVSELKILTNYSIARLFYETETPCVYRNNQFVASTEKWNHLQQACNEIDDADKLYEEIQNLNIESWYSNQNQGHYGLHLDYYIHATTPVRNFFSLLNLKILKDMILHKKDEKKDMYIEQLETFMEKQNAKVERRKKGKQKILRLKKEMENKDEA